MIDREERKERGSVWSRFLLNRKRDKKLNSIS